MCSNLSVESIYVWLTHPPFTIQRTVDIHIYLANKGHAPRILSKWMKRKKEKKQRRTALEEEKNENAIKIIQRLHSPFRLNGILCNIIDDGGGGGDDDDVCIALSTTDCIPVKPGQPFLLSPHINQHYFIYNFNTTDCIICRLWAHRFRLSLSPLIFASLSPSCSLPPSVTYPHEQASRTRMQSPNKWELVLLNTTNQTAEQKHERLDAFSNLIMLS